MKNIVKPQCTMEILHGSCLLNLWEFSECLDNISIDSQLSTV